jgi:hypothetical protein
MTQVYVLNSVALMDVSGATYIIDLAGIAVFSTLDAAKRTAQQWHTGTERDGTLSWVKSRATNGIECECQGLLYDISLQVIDQEHSDVDLTINP